MMNLPSEDELEGISVGDLAQELYPELWDKIDTSLPQQWVDWCTNRGFDPRGRVVWLHNTILGQPLPITVEGMMGICALMK